MEEGSQNRVVLSCRLGLNRGSSLWLPKAFEVTTDVIGKGWVEFIPAGALQGSVGRLLCLPWGSLALLFARVSCSLVATFCLSLLAVELCCPSPFYAAPGNVLVAAVMVCLGWQTARPPLLCLCCCAGHGLGYPGTCDPPVNP